jgi:hypothetical protein
VSKPLLVSFVLAVAPLSAEAFVCGRSLSSNELGEQVEKQIGEPGSLECLVDNLLSEQIKGLGLTQNETISTEMVSANIGAVDGEPMISYTFHFRVWAEQFDQLAGMWADERGKFEAVASEFSAQFADEVCADDRDEAAYFAAGGRINVLITLNSSTGLKRFFHETLISMEIKDCEAP